MPKFGVGLFWRGILVLAWKLTLTLALETFVARIGNLQAPTAFMP